MTVLAGRNILLTGASAGVGRHFAHVLAREGAHVACCARRKDQLDALVSEIEADGGRATAIVCDVADDASIRAAFDTAERAAGMVDSVIVNAGVNQAGPAHSIAVAELDRIVAINLRGAFLTAREGAARMIAAGTAAATPRRVVFVASILGRKVQPGAAAYSATKAGVLMLARSLAHEWARHEINVNAILPGFMPTEIVSDWFESEKGKAQIAGWPRRRMMPVADLDPALLFLLSAEARSVSGSEIVIDDTQSLA